MKAALDWLTANHANIVQGLADLVAVRSISTDSTDPTGPVFDAALAAMRAGYGKEPVPIGCGGSIGFVGPLAELLGGAPALLFGIEDPRSNAHAPNESLHEGDWRKLMASLARLFDNLGRMNEPHKAAPTKKATRRAAVKKVRKRIK